MKTISIIRNRGQLTIPDSIRKIVSWIQPMSAVSISVEKPDEIKISPHTQQKEINWDEIWKAIHLSRSIPVKKNVKSAAEIIAEDRAR